ncbi:MAG: type II secretion system protein [Planctomycetales bacterium]|nr:type II secretion system protein [Planctomycetales bacterium]
MPRRTHKHTGSRGGFTLFELMLSLALVVVATALIGSLMQLYSRNFATRGDDIRRQQLARSLLSMIADDIRSVVLEHEYDPSVLEQLLNSGGGSGGGGAIAGQSMGSSSTGSSSTGSSSSGASAGSAAAGASTGGAGSTASGAAGAGTSAASSSTSTSGSNTADLEETVTTEIPMGIYGDQTTLMIDVSRVPRPDEYEIIQTSALNATLTDLPGDLKTVTYFVQSATNQGVQDVMTSFTQSGSSSGFSSGLVRRALDRRVTAYAEETGDTDRLLRTGDLVAPEVIGIEFSYFDGTQWLQEWDSSTQALPWLIKINLAVQSASGSEVNQALAGTLVSMLTLTDREQYGIDVYELTVAIPGAQLHADEVMTEDQSAGMESMGL